MSHQTLSNNDEKKFRFFVSDYLNNGYLVPEIHSEETDSHEYLNPDPAHPPSVVKNNLYSVALRVRRNCSDRVAGDKLFVNNLILYKAYLMHSGYDEENIDRNFIKVAKMKRKETLSDKPKKRRGRPKDRKYNFVTTWDPIFPDIGKIIRKFSQLRTRNVVNCFLKDLFEWHTNEGIRS